MGIRAIYLWSLLVLLSCSATVPTNNLKNNNTDQEILFSVGDETILSEEFNYVYKKNNLNNDTTFTREDINEYLDLYVKFKLKIKEARALGMDTTQAFINEFNTYKDQLKKPYLTESKVTERLVNEAYERYKTEVKASHILILVDPGAAPSDTLKAFKLISDIREKAISGVDFAKLAREYSQDPSAKTNGGNLGYFTSFQMVYPFETMAYSTAVDDISNPVRTKFGYHLIKVEDKRASKGSVSASHIMVRIQPTSEDSIAARNKIFEIHEQALGGVSWEELARQFSDDVNTKNSGGKLKPFKVGQMPYEFQEAAFGLDRIGAISDPIMTPYGWHLIRYDGASPLEPIEELKNDIISKIGRDSRANINKKVLIQRLKKENGFLERESAKSKLWSMADTTLRQGNWKFNKSKLQDESLFSINENQYSMFMFMEYVEKFQKPNSYDPKYYLQLLYEDFVDSKVLSYEEEHLEEKYIDYRMLVKEYREGILLFQLMEEQVWSKAVEDTVGLKKFYQDNRNKYKWPERIKATIYNANGPEILSEIKERITLNDTTSISKGRLEEQYNAETALALEIEENIFEPGDNQIIDGLNWEVGLYDLNLDGRFILVNIEQVLPSSIKPFGKVRGLAISDYQNHLEKIWVDTLRDKYPVIINKLSLNNVYDFFKAK